MMVKLVLQTIAEVAMFRFCFVHYICFIYYYLLAYLPETILIICVVFLYAGAGEGDVGVVIVDPTGRKDTVPVTLENKGDNVFRCTYQPLQEGPHSVQVTFAGQPIPKSPFPVNVSQGEAAYVYHSLFK